MRVGEQYGLVGCATNMNLLTLSNNGTTSASGSVIDGVYLDTRTAGSSTSGAAIVNYGTFGVQMSHLRINNGCIGVDEQLSVINRFEGGSIRSGGVSLAPGCGGIRVGHGSTGAQLTDFHITDTHIDSIGEYAVLVKDVGGLFINGSDFIGSLYGTLIQPGANQHVKWLTASNTYLGDTTCNAALRIDPSAATASVTGLRFTQTWTSSAGTGTGCDAPGVIVQNTGGGVVKGVHFLGHRSVNNATYGMIINSGVSDVTVDNSEICNNSTATLEAPGTTYDGIAIGNGASGVAIRNNRISANCINIPSTSTFQKSGVLFVGTSSSITIIGNDLRGHSASSIGGASPTGASIIRDNTGMDTVNINVAGAATITAPINPIITLTGTGSTISTINGMWDGREARVYMVDGSNTFATGGNLCNGGTYAQFAMAMLYKVPGANCISVK